MNKDIDSSDVFHEFETGQLDRLIEYLQVVDTSYSDSKHPNYIMTLKSFIQQYDIRRNKNFSKHSELEEWYESIQKQTNITKHMTITADVLCLLN